MYEFILSQVRFDSESFSVSFAWTVSYLVSILWQHSLHRFLVFGTGGDYWGSLWVTYVAYTTSLLVSMGMTYALTEYAGLSSQLVWLITLSCTGMFNYFSVKDAFAPADSKEKSS
tara:strand:+ start:792 stop:1136 length:345 start_codon:yes stop_codon:yes gene_type:complete